MEQLEVIKSIQAMPWHPYLVEWESKAQQELQFLLDQQESIWRQKARTLWLKEGDRNTKFFHSTTLQRRSRKKINRLRSMQGEWLQKEADIDAEIFSFFNILFSSEGAHNLERALQFIPARFTADMNSTLCLSISDDEVKSVVFSMKLLKAPGPDGVPLVFFQSYWKTVGPAIVAPEQMAFVEGRSISENVLIAHEAFHHLRHMKRERNYLATVKLDMQKAYDRIEWAFLSRILQKMGLCGKWVQLISQCVSTVSYSFLLNGVQKGSIQPSRGIRQGGPLSPSLFVLCTECLTSLISGVVENGSLSGLRIKNSSPTIMHSFFVDDCLIFLQANHGSFRSLRDVLLLYCDASGDWKEKKAAFQNIKDRTIAKIAGWKEKLLSQAGKEVLIKAVVTTSPSYHMSHFKLPHGLLDDISKAGGRPSWVWRSILHGRQLLSSGLLWIVGNGLAIHIWDDPWIPALEGFRLHLPRPPECPFQWVSDIIDSHAKWDVAKLRAFFLPFEIECILQIPISSEGCDDQLCWGPAPNGIFSVKSAYRVGTQLTQCSSISAKKAISTPKEVWSCIWNSIASPKVKSFLWKACLGAIGVLTNLKKSRIVDSDICGGCGIEAESTEHALLYCPLAKQAWFASSVSLKVDAFPGLSLSAWILK
ncbi:uncharacterized protein LOC122651120 [Telopea speciosissima]|uniref:uncharacterized protein LOC122651120 n=1 Tax=Telopea speciosissima TaxID=54955 RepID=UPI001CC46CCD|nr:uncharacterized protein LOC122651120 [Telopea speciosissima]